MLVRVRGDVTGSKAVDLTKEKRTEKRDTEISQLSFETSPRVFHRWITVPGVDLPRKIKTYLNIVGTIACERRYRLSVFCSRFLWTMLVCELVGLEIPTCWGELDCCWMSTTVDFERCTALFSLRLKLQIVQRNRAEKVSECVPFSSFCKLGTGSA